MADEPALQPAHRRLDVALERERVVAPGEGLVRVEPRGAQQLRPTRKIERVSVPVQHRRARVQLRERRGAAGIGERERTPTELLALALVDAGAQRLRHDLRAKTEPEHRTPELEATLDDGDL